MLSVRLDWLDGKFSIASLFNKHKLPGLECLFYASVLAESEIETFARFVWDTA